MAEEVQNEVAQDATAAVAAAAAAAVTTDAAIAEEAAKKKKKLLIIIIVALVVVLGGGIGVYMYMKSSAEARLAAEIEEKKPENILKKQLAERKLNAPPIYIPLDEIVVNLPGRGGEHYLQTKIVLRTAD